MCVIYTGLLEVIPRINNHIMMQYAGSGPLCTKRTDVIPRDLVKYRSREISVKTFSSALKFGNDTQYIYEHNTIVKASTTTYWTLPGQNDALERIKVNTILAIMWKCVNVPPDLYTCKNLKTKTSLATFTSKIMQYLHVINSQRFSQWIIDYCVCFSG